MSTYLTSEVKDKVPKVCIQQVDEMLIWTDTRYAPSNVQITDMLDFFKEKKCSQWPVRNVRILCRAIWVITGPCQGKHVEKIFSDINPSY